MIRVCGLSVAYGAVRVLQDINLEIEQGEFVLITGQSGCGKSTLALALSGLIPNSTPARITGRVEINGLDTQNCNLREIVQQVGIVLQNPSSQLFHLRVEDEVAFGPRNLGLDDDEVSSRTDWALKATGLDSLREYKPSELSGGQKQCVAIASMLAMRSKILILDEPTASLDVPSTRRILDTLKTLNQEYGVTIVIVEHRLADLARMASRVILMDKCQIILDGIPDSILFDPSLQDKFGLRRMTNETQVAWESLIKVDDKTPNGRQPLLTLENVTAGYNRIKVIQDITITLYPGDFVALVGNNGTGKSTLGLVAAGLLKPLSGVVRYLEGVKPRPGLDVAMLFQNPTDQLFTDSVDEEVAFGPRNYDRFDSGRHDEILKEADLLALRERRPLMLSVGQQQRTTLAACLGLQPSLLILDEPTLGQDWGHLQRLMNYLIRLNRQGTAILLISHDYKLVHRYTHSVFLMKNGRIQSTGQFKRSPFSKSRSISDLKQGVTYETVNS